jgi:transposase
MSVQVDAANGVLEVSKNGLPEQAGERAVAHAAFDLTNDGPGEPEPEPEDKEIDAADRPVGGAADVPPVATELTEVQGGSATAGVASEEGSTTSPPDDSPANYSIADEPVSDEKQSVPQFNKQVLDSLLDELTGELVALKDFPHEIDDRAFEHEWLGRHTDLTLGVYRAELLKTSKYTADIDEHGKLLGDPVKHRLALENGADITLRIHAGFSPAQKSDFILRAQARDRSRTEAEDRDLKRRIILAGRALGLDYEKIAKMTGVHPNTVRNVEARAAADSNSKFGNTKKDRRLTASTPENIKEARRLHEEGKSNSEIARLLGVSPATVTKLLADPADPAKAVQAIEDIEATDGVPELHRPMDTQAYINWLKDSAARTRQKVEGVSDIEEMKNYSLCSSLGMAFANFRLRKLLSGGGETDVKQVTVPRDSSPDKSGHEPDTILRGIVMADEGEEVFVALSVGGGGVIEKRNYCLAMYGPLPVDGVVRVRPEGFDWKRGLWKLRPQGRQTPAPAPGAIAGSHRDDRCSPDTRLAGSKAGPKETGVTK